MNLCQVLLRLRENQLYVKFEKCIFKQTSLRFLGYVVSDSSLMIDPEKASAILIWPQPQAIKAILRFLGFANYYRQFISHFSSLTKPISSLTRKGSNPKVWSPEAEETFLTFKRGFAEAPILHRP
ncbi:uncharacterized protein [Dendrobates tinctorius]|uniref:uncharacterized protein n=1 Tax=Dendrobates tinctorius TaxID=92724 RepID=UPI003CC9743F